VKILKISGVFNKVKNNNASHIPIIVFLYFGYGFILEKNKSLKKVSIILFKIALYFVLLVLFFYWRFKAVGLFL
jgi:hypothetical protein